VKRTNKSGKGIQDKRNKEQQGRRNKKRGEVIAR
jgi:hypothetical protein